MTYAITRFGNDPPRLVRITSDRSRGVHAEDLHTGKRVIIKTRNIVARHGDYDLAWKALRAARAAAETEQARIAAARRAYEKTCRQADRALIAAAMTGKAPQA